VDADDQLKTDPPTVETDDALQILTKDPDNQTFTWDGRGNDGRVWPDGAYTLTTTAVDSNRQSVGISTEVEAVGDSADLTGSSPVLSINGQDYTLDKIKRIVRSSS